MREDHGHVEVENIISRSIEKECELVGTYLTKLNIIVIAIYRSPSANVGVFFETLEEIMTNVIQQHDPETKIYLAGDFNIDMSKETATSRELLNIMNSFGLKSSVSNYTREATNSRGTVQTIIDNIYTNDTDHSARILKCGISDHHAIVVGCPLVIIPSTTCQLKTRRTSPEGLAYFSSLVSQENWDFLRGKGDAEEKYRGFLKAYLVCADIALPLQTRQTPGQKPYIDRETHLVKETLNLIQEFYNCYGGEEQALHQYVK